MGGLTRPIVIEAALRVMNDVGLDAVSTRRVAQELGIEQPSLYHHFRTKRDMLDDMAEAAISAHALAPLPAPTDDWREWFVANFRSFRRALLHHRDGARLHAGTRPRSSSLERVVAKVDFLCAAGMTRNDAHTAMLTANWFTVGAVLEEQSCHPSLGDEDRTLDTYFDADAVFDEGLTAIVDGFAARTGD